MLLSLSKPVAPRPLPWVGSGIRELDLTRGLNLLHDRLACCLKVHAIVGVELQWFPSKAHESPYGHPTRLSRQVLGDFNEDSPRRPAREEADVAFLRSAANSVCHRSSVVHAGMAERW